MADRPMTRWDVGVRSRQVVEQVLTFHNVTQIDGPVALAAARNIQTLVEDCAQQASDFGAETVLAILVDRD